MQRLNKTIKERTERPIKIIQFGEGNFLRAFVDYMVDIADEKGVLNTNVAIIKPIEFGTLERFDQQDNLYTVCLRGLEKGETVVKNRIVSCVAKTVDPFTDYAAYTELAKSPDVRFVVSNTTEAGIVFNPDDKFEFTPPMTYPGKLTKLLYERYQAFGGASDKGLIMLPVELIEKNGENLYKCVMQFIDLWKLPAGFKAWVEKDCIFCNTLVDRIVTGYPRNESAEMCEKFGYEDQLLDTAEPFGLWVIGTKNGIDKVAAEFPLDKAGFDVVFTEDITPYRDRKVRILNGAHTSMVLGAYIAGKDIVLECINDENIVAYMNSCIFDEIIPTLDLPKEDLINFANEVVSRFGNPFIRHELLSIALNSTSKWKSRVLPSVKEYVKRNGSLPQLLTFSFAAYLRFYRCERLEGDVMIGRRESGEYKVIDDKPVLEFYASLKGKSNAEVVAGACANTAFWGEDLSAIPGFKDAVVSYLDAIDRDGMYNTILGLIKK